MSKVPASLQLAQQNPLVSSSVLVNWESALSLTTDGLLNISGGIFNYSKGLTEKGYALASRTVSKSINPVGKSNGWYWIAIRLDGSIGFYSTKPSYAWSTSGLSFKGGLWYNNNVLMSQAPSFIPVAIRVEGGKFKEIGTDNILPQNYTESLAVKDLSVLEGGAVFNGLVTDGGVDFFGVSEVGITNEQVTERLQNLVNYCADNNIQDIIINDDYTLTRDLDRKTEVCFKGIGSLDGVYRRDVIPETAKEYSFFSNLSSVSLKQFRRVAEPKVVILGDSTYTYEPSAHSRMGTIQSIFSKELSKQYPDKQIEYINRAIGGQTWANANTLPTVTNPPWYTDPLLEWLHYVEIEEPDLVLIGFGMNDSSNFDPIDMDDVITKIKAFSKVPDIIVGTNMLPSLGSSFTAYTTKSSQEGRDYVAGFERTYCIAKGISFLDFNRCFNIVRDGFDIFESSLQTYQNESSDNIVNGKFTSPVDCRDFSITSYTTATSAEALALFSRTVNPMSIKTGPADGDVVFIGQSNGFVKLTLYNGIPSSPTVLITDKQIPTGNFEIIVEKQGSKFNFRMYDYQYEDDIISIENLITHGGLFYPEIGFYNLPSGFSNTVEFKRGIHTKYKPTITDDEMFGGYVDNIRKNVPDGGNGINHPTGAGANAVYCPVINSSVFTNIPSYKVSVPVRVGVSTVTPVYAHVVDNTVTLKGVIQPNAQNPVLTLDKSIKPAEDRVAVVPSITAGVWGYTVIRMSSVNSFVWVLSSTIPQYLYLDGATYILGEATET